VNRNNKNGYTTTEQQTHEIQVNNKTYSIQVDVTLFVKPPDYSTWDSDYDYYGYTEIRDIKIINIFTEDENGEIGETIEVQYSQLSKQVQKEIDTALDVLVLQ
jgi:hypothetical protein